MNHKIKIILFGEAGIGKTTLFRTFSGGDPSAPLESTIGADFTRFSWTTDNGSLLKVDLWDTSGMERFNSIVDFYIRESSLCIFVIGLEEVLAELHTPKKNGLMPSIDELVTKYGGRADAVIEDARQMMAKGRSVLMLVGCPRYILVLNKIDFLQRAVLAADLTLANQFIVSLKDHAASRKVPLFQISAKFGTNVSELKEWMRKTMCAAYEETLQSGQKHAIANASLPAPSLVKRPDDINSCVC